jgi:hypothetical protein
MKFSVISYYTWNTGYEEESKNLEQSLKDLNMDYHIEPIDSLGSWQKNCHYKPVFIKKMILAHCLPVLFVDADAIFHRYPDLFDDGSQLADCMFHLYKHNIDYPKGQVASGTLYFRYSVEALEILSDWEKMCLRNPGMLDQLALQKVIFSGTYIENTDYKFLPAEYCKIHDFPPECANPVIEHFQVSRKYKRLI